MTGFLLFVLFAAVFLAFLQMTTAKKRIELLEANVRYMREELERMRRAVEDLSRDSAVVGQPPTAEGEPAAAVPEGASASRQAAEAPSASYPPVEEPSAAGEAEPRPVAAFDAASGTDVEAKPPRLADAAGSPEVVPPLSPQPPAVGPAAAAARSSTFDWESLVGVKLFSWIAGAALVLAAIFFLRYSVEQGWFGPGVRATIGLLTGSVLVVICELRIARNYVWTANAMHGAGIAILYSTLYAMYALWHLAPAVIVFLAMLLVTAAAVYLSIRRDSVFIALLGLMGGFATPALLSSGENRPLVLFSYLLLLNAGLAWVAFKKNWPALTLGSLAFTVLYQWGWIATFLTSAQFPLAAGIFVVFAIVGSGAMWTRGAAGRGGSFRRTAIAAAIVPLAFALFGSAVPAYGTRYNVLFTFLLLMTSGLAAIAIVRGPEWLHVLGGLATVMTFVIWSGASYGHQAWPGILIWLAVFVILYLATALIRHRPDQPPQVFGPTIDRATITSGLLFVLFPVLASREPATAAPGLLFGTVFVLLLLTGAVAVLRLDRATWLIAALFVIVAEVVWSVDHLEQTTLRQGLGVYVIAALIFLAVPVAARELTNAAHIALTAHLFLMVVAAGFSIPPWPLFTALAVIDLAVAASALYLRRPSLLILATVESQVVLMFWSAVAVASPWPLVALGAALAVAAGTIACFALGVRLEMSRFDLTGAAAFAVLGGSMVAMIAGARAEMPLFGPLLVTHAILLIALLGIAWVTESHVLAIVGAIFAAMAAVAARSSTPGREFTFAAVLYALFIAYPLLLGARARKSIEPYLAAVMASVAFFVFARDAMMSAGLEWMIGFLPLAQALVMIVLVVRILRFEPAEERQLTRLALVAGTALAFITVAIPLQLDKEWITLGWALEAAALVWLYQRIPHRGLLLWSGALFAIVLARLVLNPAVLDYHPASNVAILNWYLYTYVLAAGAFFAGAWLWPAGIRWGRGGMATGGTVLLFALLNIEIADFYSRGPTLTFDFFSSSLAQDLTYTIGWALFAIALLVAGIVLHERAPRVAAICLLAVTILKCFLHDLARLGGLYRVGSLLGLAASLVVVGLLLQRFVMARSVKPPAEQQA